MAGTVVFEKTSGIEKGETLMNAEQLKQILEEHSLWLAGDDSGKRADLLGADLPGADLARTNLTGADLPGANLPGADLTGADLSDAYLPGADLTGADLSDAYLAGAYLDKENDLSLQGNNPLLMINPIGSESGTLIAYKTNKGIYLCRGCFVGTMETFLAAVQKKHGDRHHGAVYRAACQFIEAWAGD